MAVVALKDATRKRLEIVGIPVVQHDFQLGADLAEPGPVILDGATGKVLPSNAAAGGTAKVWGIAVSSGKSGQTVTVVRVGVLEGWDLDALNFQADVFASDTAGKADTAAGTVSVKLGDVMPVYSQAITAVPKKVLRVQLNN